MPSRVAEGIGYSEDVLVTTTALVDDDHLVGTQIRGHLKGAGRFQCGFNAAGISMTGNAVACSDIRPGVPRMLIARAIFGCKND
jgi:hypothetical protein